jgi:hypothetical protein
MSYNSETEDNEDAGSATITAPEGGFGGVTGMKGTWFSSKGDATAYSDDWTNSRLVLLPGLVTSVTANKFSVLLPLENTD